MLYSNFLNPNPNWHIPTAKECYTLWDTYDMLDNIRVHCSLVAKSALLLIQSLPTYTLSDLSMPKNILETCVSETCVSKKDTLLTNELSKDLIIPKYYVDNFKSLQKKWTKDKEEIREKTKEDAREENKVEEYGTQHLSSTKHLAGTQLLNAHFLDKGLTKKSIIAAALLHDIAKTYTIKHGGDHAMLGSAFVRENTGNPYLAHAVYAHIIWHWGRTFTLSEQTIATQECDEKGNKIPFQSQVKQCFTHNPITLPLIVSYADKRVTHSKIVTLDERFANLYERYGKNEQSRARIHANHMQTKILEDAFIQFGMDLSCQEQDVLAIDLKDYI